MTPFECIDDDAQTVPDRLAASNMLANWGVILIIWGVLVRLT
jgi:hypothetical protein